MLGRVAQLRGERARQLVRMASEGEDLSDSSEDHGERHDFPDDTAQAEVTHAAQPWRISLSSPFSRKSAKGGRRPAASHGTMSDDGHHRHASTKAVAKDTVLSGHLKGQTSTLLQLLPPDAAEVQEWHPKRIFAAVVQFVASRVDDSNTLTHLKRLRG